MEAARLSRRSAKGKLTRSIRTVTSLIADKRTDGEIVRAMELMRLAYTELSTKHDSYCDLISDDVKYDEAEEWMEESRATVLSSEVAITEYLRTVLGKRDIMLDTSKGDEQLMCHRTESITQSGYQGLADINGTTENHHETTGLGNQNTAVHKAVHDTPHADSRPTILGSSTSKLKKDFIPKFEGNVRDYAIFRADFKHIVEKTCDDRDAITVLRSSVTGKPAELIRGITNDYKAAWEYLDSVYGDARYVSDAVTHDIVSFPCLRDGEDIRFCDFVHLLRRSYSTLKELERPEDMDNNHMLALVEQKLCNEDRKVWARHLVQQERRATFEQLLKWMKSEMEARMRSSAPLRTAVQSDHVVCNTVASDYMQRAITDGYTRDTCWICRSCDHWVDQCEVLRQMSPQERLEKIQDNHACLCCMKLASANHTTETCYRRRKCSIMSDGQPCDMNHHPLLHDAVHYSSVGITSLAANTAILPVLSVRALGTCARSTVTNTLLDSGAQISLIRTDVAAKLGLNGQQRSISLKKVGGHTEQIYTKEYTLKLQSLETSKTYDIKVIGIPSISENTCNLSDMHHLEEELKLSGVQVNRKNGPVDILIGIDHAHLHVGETRQGAGGVVARHSPLGWVIFGACTREQSVNAVLHVGINTGTGNADISSSKFVGSPRAHSCVDNKEINKMKCPEESSDITNDLLVNKQPLRKFTYDNLRAEPPTKENYDRSTSDGIYATFVTDDRNGNNNNCDVSMTVTRARCATESEKNDSIDNHTITDALSCIANDGIREIKAHRKFTDNVPLADDVLHGLDSPEYHEEENSLCTTHGVQMTEPGMPIPTDTRIITNIEVECQRKPSTIKATFSALKNFVLVGVITICIAMAITCMMKPVGGLQCIYVGAKSEDILYTQFVSLWLLLA